MKISVLVVLIMLFLLSFYPRDSHAQEASGSSVKHVEYDLAFPGILPDNSLYKLKVLRDKISAFLILDSLKKVEYFLLQTDKGMLATAMLIDKNKIELAEETAMKAEHNITLATYELKRLLEKPSNELFEKLKTASLKHQEVLDTLAKRVPSENRESFIRVFNFSKTNQQTIEKLQSKKYYN